MGDGYCSLPDSAGDAVEYLVTGEFLPVDGQLEHLLRIAGHAARIGVPLVFVSHPMPRRADTLQHIAFAQALRARLGSGGAPFLDLALGHDLDDRHHFADHGHLNQAGVDRFNPRLIDTLEAMGLLRARDVLGDPAHRPTFGTP